MHQRIFHIRNGVVNSIGDAKYADNLCFHEKRFQVCSSRSEKIRMEVPGRPSEFFRPGATDLQLVSIHIQKFKVYGDFALHQPLSSPDDNVKKLRDVFRVYSEWRKDVNISHYKSPQDNLDEITTATRYEMRSAEKKWNPRASVPKPRTKKKIRTILVPAYKAPRSDDPRMKKIAEMFLAPIFKNSKQNADSEDLSKKQTSEATETQNAIIKKQIILPKSLIGDDPNIDDYSRKKATKTKTTIDKQSMFKPPLNGSLEGDKKFAYSKLTDGPECDVYEKQNFKMSDDWYRLRDRQRADFNFNLREDMKKATKDERINWMLDAVSSNQATNESSKQATCSEKKLSKKPNFLTKFSNWVGRSRKTVYL